MVALITLQQKYRWFLVGLLVCFAPAIITKQRHSENLCSEYATSSSITMGTLGCEYMYEKKKKHVLKGKNKYVVISVKIYHNILQFPCGY